MQLLWKIGTFQVSGALFTLGAQPETPPIVESSAAAITKSEKVIFFIFC